MLWKTRNGFDNHEHSAGLKNLRCVYCMCMEYSKTRDMDRGTKIQLLQNFTITVFLIYHGHKQTFI